ncbi:hypothetical protein OE88DRAFT_563301 [Heliocybe sulcata]|uniref:F-box domain-containing protein n=1 Tax=Heliocybe sulcata TaxID=5364 RepID=A0A5C3MWW8_9AGAM|nr:hypothetical protein OE88DRAFT_563301 [Heliocybe sulcata]
MRAGAGASGHGCLAFCCKRICSMAAFPPVPPPITAVPNEILAEFFVELLEQVGTVQRDGTVLGSVEEARIVIMLVCQHWHAVAVHHRPVWTYIELGPHVSLSISQRVLERAGSLPLHIRIYSFDPRSNTTTLALRISLLKEFMELLLPVAPRWRSLIF